MINRPISPDAADLIDSAQTCAAKMARCCADKDAEIAELEATVEYYQHQVLDQLEVIFRLQEEAARRDRAYDALHREAVEETANVLVSAEIVSELRTEIVRLREAILDEAERHRRTVSTPISEMVECGCPICLIAREEEK